MGLIEDRRVQLHEKLCTVLGSRNVYFQPPNGTQINYPCIIYKNESSNSEYADDKTYKFVPEYSITCISPSSIDNIAERLIEEFPMIRFVRHYVADNLSHDILNLFY